MTTAIVLSLTAEMIDHQQV